jgi:hypothetical protein
LRRPPPLGEVSIVTTTTTAPSRGGIARRHRDGRRHRREEECQETGNGVKGAGGSPRKLYTRFDRVVGLSSASPAAAAAAAAAATRIALFSAFNALGRVSFGVATDYLARRHGVSRLAVLGANAAVMVRVSPRARYDVAGAHGHGC